MGMIRDEFADEATKQRRIKGEGVTCSGNCSWHR